MKIQGYTVVIEPDENNTFHGYAPALRGCHTCGDSVPETIENLKEAMELYLEVWKESGQALPKDIPQSKIGFNLLHQVA